MFKIGMRVSWKEGPWTYRGKVEDIIDGTVIVRSSEGLSYFQKESHLLKAVMFQKENNQIENELEFWRDQKDADRFND